jgi:trehalose/maltose transport system substrate-binding protein
MRIRSVLQLSTWVLASVASFAPPAFGKTKITIACGANGIERQLCVTAAETWANKTGNEVQIFSTPNESNERLSLYQQLLGAKSKDVDVFQIDTIWPGLLASHFIDVGTMLTPEEEAAHFPQLIANNTVDGKLVAVPWFTDAGVLYYRSDLLKKHGFKAAPATWEELGKIAETIQTKERAAGNSDLWGYVFQGKPYEGLTCNAIEWLASFTGVPVVNSAGQVQIATPEAARALTLWSGWIGTIAPQGVLSYAEEDARGVFQSGKAVFMRNWPYAWALLNSNDSPVKGKVAMASLPAGTSGRAATLGGWGLAISKYSANPDVAADLVKFLTSAEQQRVRALEGSFNPTLTALYDDATLLKKNPHLKELKPVFLSAVARPAQTTKNKYNRLSSDVWNTVYEVLSKGGDPMPRLKALESRVASYSNGNRW